MAVQAQYPSNAFMPECRNRGRDNWNYMASGFAMASVPVEEEYEHNAANLLRLCNAGGIFGQAFNGTVFSDPESELTCNLSGSRKRPRQDEQQQQLLLAQRQRISQQLQLMSMPEFQHKNMTTVTVPPSGSMAQAPHLVSTGLQLAAYDDSRLNQNATSTSGRNNTIFPALVSLLGDDLSAQLQQQNEEIERFMRHQSEKVRLTIEEKNQRHSRALVATVEEGIMRKLKEKETELENATRRNAELEDHVKQLTMDNQIWQTMAKNHEAMVNTLRNNLEQVVAQCREHSREGYGDSEADDAESCCHNDTAAADEHARTLKENKELKAQMTCRVCRRNDICILLLPCRHLCLCKECGGRLDTCPLCNSLKDASVQIYMS
uniref:RING-type domain-containing protein n=1 Tax=Araucaria cunninghamii TaxID=56994 RepID=A0A0D6R431_ARACU